MTTPDWVPTMRRAAALVTDGGGVTCHAAIVGQELRLPTVVATRTATSVLRDGEIVTVDGTAGEVREGRPPATGRNGAPTPAAATTVEATAEPTATLLYVNLAIAEHAEEVAALPVDGVGLLRAEFRSRRHPGRAPEAPAGHQPAEEFVARMAEQVLRITRAFASRPVVYRAVDFRTNEFRGLTGGEEFEPVEANPMIGYRGCFRYVRDPELFALDLDVLTRVREQTPNLHLIDPVRAYPLGARSLSRGHRRPSHRPRPRAAPGSWPRCPRWSTGSRSTRPRHRRRVHRVERPHPTHAGRGPRLRHLRRAVRRVGRGGAVRHPPHHRGRPRRRHHVVAVRAGALQPPPVRRVPGAARHHLDLGEPRCGGARPAPSPEPSGSCSTPPAELDMNPDVRLGRIAGVEVAASWSLLVIVGLITWSLGAAVLPGAAPGAPAVAV